MAMLKCKMCGGELEIIENSSIFECTFCRSKQTIPNLFENQDTAELFNKAIGLHKRCEFDKAEAVYESIIEKNPEEAEAHWGLILCKYGIEYVEDPETLERIPTCHRASYDAILADESFLKVMELASEDQRELYESEANKIDELQKNILALSQVEEPYDVFICYKETDEAGERTVDSTLANDIYHQLTSEGYKVFYSAITLENKLGQEYEPCIFSALNTARVMLVIGTKPEYFNAVWVKNEWSRFLKLMKNDTGKILIPCYKEMDAYELPAEFAHFQAQDMSKLGFVSDLVRGIGKITGKQDEASSGELEPTMKRINMFLEDGDFESADIYCERALNVDPENIEVYKLKLCAEYGKSKLKFVFEDDEALETVEHSPNYIKAIKFGDTELEELLSKARVRQEATETRYTEEVIAKNKQLAPMRERALAFKTLIHVNGDFTLALKKNGRVLAQGDLRLDGFVNSKNAKKLSKKWRGVNSLAISKDYIVMLKKNNKMIIASRQGMYPSCDFKEWKNLVDLNSTAHDIVAIKVDGELLTTKPLYLPERSYQEPESWDGIVSIACNDYNKIGLRTDGSLIAVGDNCFHECEIEDWENIDKLFCKYSSTVAITKDNHVLAVGDNKHGQYSLEEWREIVDIEQSVNHTVGLRMDGGVVAIGRNHMGQCDVSRWENIVAIACDATHTYGLQLDGRVVVAGGKKKNNNTHLVSEWTDIVAIKADNGTVLGLRKDGRVLALGNNKHGQCETEKWRLFKDSEEYYIKLRMDLDKYEEKLEKLSGALFVNGRRNRLKKKISLLKKRLGL